MIRLNMHEAKTHLSMHLARLKEGDRIILCKRNVPVAEIRLIPKEKLVNRVFGLAKDKIVIPPEFFDPLPEDILKAFEGEGGGPKF